MSQVQLLPDNHPFFEACENRQLEEIERHFRNGISVYSSSDFRPEPLAYAIESKDINFLLLLFKYGYEVDHVAGAFNRTGFYSVIEGDETSWVDYFISKGATINWRDKYGFSPLMLACGVGNINILNLLLKSGADLESQTNKQETALLLASKAGKYDVVKWLLDHGADINAEDKKGKSALDWAKANGHQKIVDLLQVKLGS